MINLHGTLIAAAIRLSTGMRISIHVYVTDKRAAARVVYMDPKNPLHCGIDLLSHETFGVYRCRPMIGKRRPRRPSRNQVSALDNDAERSSLSRCIVDDEFPRMTVHSKRTRVPVI